MLQNMKRKNIWIWFVIIIYIGFIFHNSLTIATVSEDTSLDVAKLLLRILNHFTLYTSDIMHFNHYVRKLAHFLEYAGLGFLIGLAMQICPIFKKKSLNFVLFLVFVPVIDECLQYFTEGRSCQVSDMILDACGFLFGGLVIYIFILIIKDLTKK